MLAKFRQLSNPFEIRTIRKKKKIKATGDRLTGLQDPRSIFQVSQPIKNIGRSIRFWQEINKSLVGLLKGEAIVQKGLSLTQPIYW